MPVKDLKGLLVLLEGFKRKSKVNTCKEDQSIGFLLLEEAQDVNLEASKGITLAHTITVNNLQNSGNCCSSSQVKRV